MFKRFVGPYFFSLYDSSMLCFTDSFVRSGECDSKREDAHRTTHAKVVSWSRDQL